MGGFLPAMRLTWGVNWNRVFRETVYDLLGLLKKRKGGFLPFIGCLFSHCVQTPYKSDFCIIGPLENEIISVMVTPR